MAEGEDKDMEVIMAVEAIEVAEVEEISEVVAEAEAAGKQSLCISKINLSCIFLPF